MRRRAIDNTESEKDNIKGLDCRQCGCRHFRVIYTRPAWGGRIMCRRECRKCGERITTCEKPLGRCSRQPPFGKPARPVM